MKDKAALRAAMRKKVRGASPETLREAGQHVVRRLLNLEAFQRANTIALYMPIAGEVDVEPLFEQAWTMGKTTCMPAYDLQTQTYSFAAVDASTAFQTARFGIREPIKASAVPSESIDLIAVPGIAFDARGHRLGRGGGYYDRLLQDFHGLAVAAAFDFQVVDAVPVEPHDQSVDLIITHRRIINVCNEH